MSIINQLKSYDFAHKFWNLLLSGVTFISPSLNTKIYYRISHGKKLKINNPQEFNEKLLWLKLNTYYNNDLIRTCADKYAVRDYVIRKNYGNTLNDLIGVYSSVDEINWVGLPKKFALKLNYGCTYNVICPNRDTLNIDSARKKLRKWMKSKYYLSHSEMQYKGIERKILLEKYIEGPNGEFPADYKFYCFNGEPRCILYCSERKGVNAEKTMYDLNGEILPYRYDNTVRPFIKPKCFEEMLKVCRALSEDFPFVRVDLYELDGRVLFGELTFTPAGGTGKYTEKGNRELGAMLKI